MNLLFDLIILGIIELFMIPTRRKKKPSSNYSEEWIYFEGFHNSYEKNFDNTKGDDYEPDF